MAKTLQRALRGLGTIDNLQDPLPDNMRSCRLVILDVDTEGFEALAAARASQTALLCLTSNPSVDTQMHLLSLGATEVIAKPLHAGLFKVRVEALLKDQQLRDELRELRRSFESRLAESRIDMWDAVREASRSEDKLRRSLEDTVRSFAVTAEHRVPGARSHVERMSAYCEIIARGAGLDRERARQLKLASRLHDIGKIALPDDVLQARGELSVAQRELMERHPQLGFEILDGSGSDFLRLAATLALMHHERFDGSGYPTGVRGAGIPLEAQIAGLADLFDGLTTARTRRPARSLVAALKEIKGAAGRAFDRDLVDAFVDQLDLILAYDAASDSPVLSAKSRAGAQLPRRSKSSLMRGGSKDVKDESRELSADVSDRQAN